MKTGFIITIDTEGDNIWGHPETVTTRNAAYLPRFQTLCERYGYKPVYLVNHEMANDPEFQAFGRAALDRGTCEIGLHVHAWDSPPLDDTHSQDDHCYQYEFSDEMLFAKMDTLTRRLEEVFRVRPVSHRAGRWGFDARVARILAKLGYLVDCSVAPGACFRRYKGRPDGSGGPDFFRFPVDPYFMDLTDIRKTGNSPLLEVPVTIRPNYAPLLEQIHHSVVDGLPGKVLRRVCGQAYSWLRPNGRNLPEILGVVDWGVARRLPVLEFAFHSSELMPGGSPVFKTDAHIETLYEHLEALFAHIASKGIVGMTLAEFRGAWSK